MIVSILCIDSSPVFLPDIGEYVAPGDIVQIPTEKAYRSIDLWQAIAQRKLYQMKSPATSPEVVPPPPAPPPAAPPPAVAVVSEPVVNLSLLEAKIDRVLAYLEGGHILPTLGPALPMLPRVPTDPEVPLFIPSAKVEGLKIEGTVAQETAGTSVTTARDLLRSLKQNKG